MNNFIEQCNQWVRTGDYIDFYKIFLTRSHLTFDEVNDKCTELGRAYPTWFTKSTKKILYNLVEICDDYENHNLSTISISEKYEVPRTTLQAVISPLGIMRSHDEAAETASREGRHGKCRLDEERLSTGNINYYKFSETDIRALKSSWEVAYVQQLVDLGIKFEYEVEYIPYTDSDGLDHVYIPDFKVYLPTGIEIHEVKPLEFINSEINQLKFTAARRYCADKGYIFKVITESEIDWDSYPNWNDSNLIGKPKYDPQVTDHFITKVYDGTYTYKNHPLTNDQVSYDSIMEYINSQPKYSVTIYDIYEMISRNGIICRLRDEAPEDEKDIRRWMCKYLADVAMTNSAFDVIKLEYQYNGIRDFGLVTFEDLVSCLSNLNRLVSIGDVEEILGYARNKTLRYCEGVLNVNPYELIEQINREFESQHPSI